MCTNSKEKGFVTDITEKSLSMAGHKVKFVSMPWARAVNSVKSGTTDGIISTAKSEAPGLIFPREEIAVQKDCFFGIKNNWKIDKLDSFEGKHIIVFNGWGLENEYISKWGKEKYEKTFKEFSIDDEYFDRVMRMINLNRYDAFWYEPTVFKYKVSRSEKHKNSKVKNLGCVTEQLLYLGLNPNNHKLSQELARDFDISIRKMRNSGSLKKILKKYGLKDWK